MSPQFSSAKPCVLAIDDEKDLLDIIQTTLEGEGYEVLAANPSEVERYRGGQLPLFGFLVGLAMKASKGKGDPKLVNARLRAKLDGGA